MAMRFIYAGILSLMLAASSLAGNTGKKPASGAKASKKTASKAKTSKPGSAKKKCYALEEIFDEIPEQLLSPGTNWSKLRLSMINTWISNNVYLRRLRVPEGLVIKSISSNIRRFDVRNKRLPAKVYAGLRDGSIVVVNFDSSRGKLRGKTYRLRLKAILDESLATKLAISGIPNGMKLTGKIRKLCIRSRGLRTLRPRSKGYKGLWEQNTLEISLADVSLVSTEKKPAPASQPTTRPKITPPRKRKLTPEQKAENQLTLARNYIKSGLTEKAREILQSLIEDYMDTPAAGEAIQELETLDEEEE